MQLHVVTGLVGTDDDALAAQHHARARGRLTGSVADLSAAGVQWTRIEARFERACTTILLPDRIDEGRAELRALGCPSAR